MDIKKSLNALRRNKLVIGLFFVVFIAGFIWAFNRLELRLEDIDFIYALLIFLILAPANLLVAGYTLCLSAEMLKKSIPYKESFFISSIAAFSEVLPLPGGGIVRGAALVRAGATVQDSAWVVGVNGLITLTSIFLLVSAPLIYVGNALGYICFAIGLAMLVAVLWWMRKNVDGHLIWKSFFIRAVMLAISTARLLAAFYMINYAIEVEAALMFLLTTSLSTAVAIAPAGLGLNEMLAAALAVYIHVDPAAAFMAVSLNRLLGLAIAGLLSWYAIQKLHLKSEGEL